MATDAAAEAKEAYADIKDEGFLVTVVIEGDPGDYDPVTDSYVGGVADVEYPTYAVRKEYRIDQIDGTIVEMSDSMLVISAMGMPVIDASSIIKIGAVKQEIVSVKAASPANIPIVYTVQVRG